MATFTYFAYGSNMLLARLQKRCKTATLLGVAVARGYTLAFSKKSKDGSGKATIAKTENDNDALYGVLYEIDAKDRAQLDRHEGFGYDRTDEFVVRRADNNEKLIVTTYIANHSAIDNNMIPYHWYKKLIIAGARQRKLPGFFIANLETRRSVHDPCPERITRKEALAMLKESGWIDA